jgi:glycosyltransferase 2 family protein
MSQRGARRRPWLLLVVSLALAAAIVALAGDLRHLGDSLGQVQWAWFAVALGLSLTNYAARWVRWQLYLRHQRIDVPLASSVIVFGAGLSLAITPAKLGELAKSYLLREMHGVPTSRSAPIVIAERVTDLVALLVVAVIGVSIYGVAPGLVASAAGVIGLGLVLLAWPRPAHALLELATRPAKLRRLRGPITAMYDDLAVLCRPRQLAMATAIAIPAWMCECLGFGLILHAFPATEVAMGIAIVIYALTTIAGALSFLPGGLGVTEGAMTLLLVKSATRITSTTAVAATMLTRFATLWFGVLVGLLFMVAARRRIRALADLAATSAAAAVPASPTEATPAP